MPAQAAPTSKAMTREDRHAATRLVIEIRDLRVVPPVEFVARETMALGVAAEGKPVAAGHYLKDDSGEWATWRAEFAQRLIDKLWSRELERQDAIRQSDPNRARREFDDLSVERRRDFTLERVRRAIVTGTSEMTNVADGPLDLEARARQNYEAMADERRLFGTRLPDVRNGAVDTFFGLFIALAEKANQPAVAASIREASTGVKSWFSEFERAPWIRQRNADLERQGAGEHSLFIESGPGMGNMRGPYELFRGIRERVATVPMLAGRGYDWTSARARRAAAELGPSAFPAREGPERWDPDRARVQESERQARNRSIGNLAHRAGPLGRLGFGIFDRLSRSRAAAREQYDRNGVPEHEAAVSWERRSAATRPVVARSADPARPDVVPKRSDAHARHAPPPPDGKSLTARERQFSAALRGAVRTWATNETFREGQTAEEKARIEKSGERLFSWIGGLDSRQLSLLHKALMGGRAIETVTDSEVGGPRGIYSAIRAERVPEIYRTAVDSGRAHPGLPRMRRPSPGDEPRALAEAASGHVRIRDAELLLAP